MNNPSTIREINQARVLMRMIELGPLSRADLARELDLMRSTTGSLVDHLLDDGMIRELQSSDAIAQVGRPSVKFELNPDHCVFKIIDIDPRLSQIYIFDFALNLQKSINLKSEQLFQDPHDFASALFETLNEALNEAKLGIKNIASAMIILPALVNRDGLVGYAPSLGWKNVPFKDIFSTLCNDQFPITLENDANAFALCEQALSENLSNNNAYFWLDDGIGGSLILENNLIRGHQGFAGEFGHIYTPNLTPSPEIPLKHSVENIIGRTGLLFQHKLNGGTDESFSKFLLALDENSKIAKKTFKMWCATLTQSLGSLVGVLNPEKIVFGGPLSALAKRGQNEIEADLKNLILMEEATPEIVISNAQSQDIAQGCAHMLRQDYINIKRDAFFAST